MWVRSESLLCSDVSLVGWKDERKLRKEWVQWYRWLYGVDVVVYVWSEIMAQADCHGDLGKKWLQRWPVEAV